MSKPAGNFDCSALQQIQVELDRQWADSQARNVDDNVADVDALLAVKQNQNVRFADLEGKQDKDNTVKLWWLADCSADVEEDCDDRCDLGGPEPETDCKTYEITKCVKRGFTIPHNKLRTNKLTREGVMAYNILRKMKAIEEQVTREVITALYSFRGVNKDSSKPGVISGSDTYIGANYWDPNLMGYFVHASIINKMRNSYLLQGNNMWQMNWQVEKQQTDGQSGAANLAKVRSLPAFSDLINVDSVIGDPTTLMINKNAVAVVSANRYDSNPVTVGTKQFYSLPSKRIPGFVYDVGFETVCENDDWKDNVSLWLTWDIFQNPLPCDVDMTGILSFLCGEP